MYLYHADKLEEGQEFIVTGDKSQLQPKVQLQDLLGGGGGGGGDVDHFH
jgi:hypothetical protein